MRFRARRRILLPIALLALLGAVIAVLMVGLPGEKKPPIVLPLPLPNIDDRALTGPDAGAFAGHVAVDALMNAADTIVLGRVTHQKSRWDEGIIVTDVDVDVVESIKGTPSETLALTVAGGAVGEIGMRRSNQAAFAEGEQAVLFLHAPEGGDRHELVGGAQGKVEVHRGASGESFVHWRGPGDSEARKVDATDFVRGLRATSAAP